MIYHGIARRCLGEEGEEADTIKSYVWECTGGGFEIGTNENGTPKLAPTVTGRNATWVAWTSPGSYTIRCLVEDTPKPIEPPATGTRDDEVLVREITIQVLPVQLLVRREGSGATFGTEARVAAGGCDAPEQRADVKVRLDPDVTDVPIGVVKISKGGNGYKEGDAVLTMANAFNGSLKSSNLTGKSVKLKLVAGPGSIETTINQEWDSDPEWVVPENFIYDKKVDVSYSPRLWPELNEEPVPIKKQSVLLSPAKMVVYLWNKDVGDYYPYEFGPGVPKWSVVKQLAVFDDVAETGPGIYSSKMKVTHDRKRLVDVVEIEAVGKSVWEDEVTP